MMAGKLAAAFGLNVTCMPIRKVVQQPRKGMLLEDLRMLPTPVQRRRTALHGGDAIYTGNAVQWKPGMRSLERAQLLMDPFYFHTWPLDRCTTPLHTLRMPILISVPITTIIPTGRYQTDQKNQSFLLTWYLSLSLRYTFLGSTLFCHAPPRLDRVVLPCPLSRHDDHHSAAILMSIF